MARRSIVESVFRRLLRESQGVEGSWGKYAFGAERQDTPFENDTPEESEAYQALVRHVRSNLSLNQQEVMLLWQAMEEGLYGDVLHEPTTNYVYRNMILSYDDINEITGLSIGWGEEGDSGSAPVKGLIGRRRRYAGDWIHSSAWTTNLVKAARWDNSVDGERQYICLLVASVADNPHTFLEGPGGFYKVNILKDFNEEDETIALGSVRGAKLYWYRPRLGEKFPHEIVAEKN